MNLTVYVHEAYLNCLTELGKLPKNLPLVQQWEFI
jgi:hypothetical protein